jgi:glyoxylate reductase
MAKLIKITRKIPDVGIRLLKAKGYQVEIFQKPRPMSRDELLKFVKNAHAVVTLLYDKVDSTVLDAAGKQLKIVANYAVGFDNLDLRAAAERKIFVTNAPHPTISDAVAEHTFALMNNLARRISESDRFVRAGKYKAWDPDLMLGESLEGKVIGIVGLGRIGSEVARHASRGFGMKVLYNDVRRNEEFEATYAAKFEERLEDLLPKSDFVTIHVPLLPSTQHLMNKDRFKLMKKSAYFINTSRGPVVDEKALVEALQKKLIAGAGLDVYEFEPNISPQLLSMENVVLTPHTASATIEAREAMSLVTAQNIIAAFEGRMPPNIVKAS